MSFFKKSTGEVAQPQTTFDQSAPELIPDSTTLHCLVKEAKINISSEYGDTLQIQWQCVAPQQYANRVVFQSVKLFDGDPKKRDKAIDMFAAIDTNATGGKLLESGQEPNNMTLQQWTGKQMLIKAQIWEMDGRKGNWISAVMPRNQASQPAPVSVGIDDDIPF
jgi:hypothetical protein